MSRNMETSYTDCQMHRLPYAKTSTVSFTSPFLVDTKLNKSNKPDHQGSIRSVTSSVATIHASDTDEGDYETSSEGMVPSKRNGTEIRGAQAKESLYVYFKEKSISLSKLAAFDRNVSPIKEELIPDPPHELIENRLTQKTTYIRGSLILVPEHLAKSKSLPIMKYEIPSDVSTNFEATDVALMSASSFARKKKMSMIVKRMAPFISPYPSTVSLTTGATCNFRGQRYEARRLESRTMLPVLCDVTPTAVIDDARSEELVAEVTLHETRNNHHTMDCGSCRDIVSTFVNDEGAANLTNDDELVDVARNPYSSIKSVYFPPYPSDPPVLPDDAAKLKRHQRVSTDVAALLKINHELGPLRYQYSEIIGKTRALGLSGTGFDLGISCLNQPDTYDGSLLSPYRSDYLLDHSRTFSRRAATTHSIENRPVLVDNTSPSPTFSIVGKLTSKDSRTSWLNENDSSRRQEAFSFAIRDLSRTLESLNDLRSCCQIRNSTSYLPATNSRASQRENILGERSCNRCVSNNDFQPSRKPDAIEKATSAWEGWSLYGINTSPSNVLRRTEYNSHRYLDRTFENSRTSSNNFIKVRKQESSVSTVVKVIDNDWHTVEEETNKRSNEHFEVLLDDQTSMAVQAKFNHDSDHRKSVFLETEHVVRNDRISSPFGLESIDRGIGPDRQISRAFPASACSPQFRVVSVNTEFRATVEKHYASRAVSPIRHPHLTNASSAEMSSNNVLLAGKMSGVFVQQVHADTSIEVVKVESSSQIFPVDVSGKDDVADTINKRNFCIQKVDSQLAAENLKLSEYDKNQVDVMMTECKKTQHSRVSDTKEKITIIPIVLTDGIPEPPRTADINVAIPRYVDKMISKLDYQIVPLEVRKSRRMPLSNKANEISQSDVTNSACSTEKFSNEKCRRASRFISRVSHNSLYTQEDYVPLTSDVARHSKRLAQITTSNARVGRNTQEYRESGRDRVMKTIPGMRSSPEDFLCET